MVMLKSFCAWLAYARVVHYDFHKRGRKHHSVMILYSETGP